LGRPYNPFVQFFKHYNYSFSKFSSLPDRYSGKTTCLLDQMIAISRSSSIVAEVGTRVALSGTLNQALEHACLAFRTITCPLA
jgi:hypothetical protein